MIVREPECGTTESLLLTKEEALARGEEFTKMLYGRVIAEDIKVDEFQSGILLEITLRYQTDNLSSVLKLTFDKELGLITE
jgi:hypothetical protein